MTSKAELDTLTAKIATLQRINPESFKALARITDLAVRNSRQESAARGAVSRRILSRLQAVHDCDREDGGGFEQIEPLGKVRQWRCLGCDRIVTLEKP